MEPDAITIRPLTTLDVSAFLAIRRVALAHEPHSFAASAEDDRALDPGFIAAALADPNQALLGAFGPGLVGVVGIFRDRHLKARHKAHIWGMYVSPDGRGRGTGRRLMEGAIQWAVGQQGIRQVHLVVSGKTPVARQLYQSLGFICWGTEPRALCIEGELVDDEHMVLILSPAD